MTLDTYSNSLPLGQVINLRLVTNQTMNREYASSNTAELWFPELALDKWSCHSFVIIKISYMNKSWTLNQLQVQGCFSDCDLWGPYLDYNWTHQSSPGWAQHYSVVIKSPRGPQISLYPFLDKGTNKYWLHDPSLFV